MQAAQLKADGKAQRVIVTGCLAQRYSEDLAGKSMVMLYVPDLRPRVPMQLKTQLLIITSCFRIALCRELFLHPVIPFGSGHQAIAGSMIVDQSVHMRNSCIASNLDALLP